MCLEPPQVLSTWRAERDWRMAHPTRQAAARGDIGKGEPSWIGRVCDLRQHGRWSFPDGHFRSERAEEHPGKSGCALYETGPEVALQAAAGNGADPGRSRDRAVDGGLGVHAQSGAILAA